MVSPKEEAAQIARLCDGNELKAVQLVEHQLNVLYTRAQVMVGIAGMVITVTGFSGRNIADTSALAQCLVVIGLAIVLAATLWVFLRVMGIRWATARLHENLNDSLEALVIYRNQKTIAYEIGGKIMGLGLISYGTAVSLMLFA